jgi:hypothetical protein
VLSASRFHNPTIARPKEVPMQAPTLEVRHVRGRYPAGRAILRSENIEASVTEVSGPVFTLRLDDTQHPGSWLEITVELTQPEGEQAW